MPLKELLEYQLSSDGYVDVDIEDIRNFVVNKVNNEDSHIAITRAFEALTGYRTASTDDDNIKRVHGND
jgi:hypothetical protein